jgi:hypothetical protein
MRFREIVEEFKHPRGIDELSEFEQEVWQKYLTLRREYRAKAEASLRCKGDGAATVESRAKPLPFT